MAKADSKVDQVLDIIKEMTILELRDLNEKIQDEFGITAAAPVAVAAAPAAGAAPAAAACEGFAVIGETGWTATPPAASRR
jgi:large subunit ribosomal protein L7/L12